MKYQLKQKQVSHDKAEGDGNKTTQIIISIFLVVATLAVYWQVQDYEFVNLDDNLYITENENIQDGVTREGIIWAFTTNYPHFWHPVAWVSHMLDYQLFGLTPKGHHLTNVFIHITNALLLFMVLMRMTGALWQSFFVAAIFALHPLNVESVAWVTERKNLLSAFFGLLTIWAYICYTEKKGVKRYCLVALLLASSLLSKPMLVTLPFVLLLLDYWPFGRLKLVQKKDNLATPKTEINEDRGENISQLIWEKIPFLLLAVGSSFMTVWFRDSVRTLKIENMGTSQARIVNALVSYIEYLEKMLWPMELSALYPHPGNTLPVWKGVICGILLVIISTVVVRMIRQTPYLAVGWFWYLGTLVPMIGIVQEGNQAMADRFTYIPLIGIFIMVAWGLPDLLARWSHRNKALSVLAGIIFPVLMTLTWAQASHWENSEKLFKHAIEVTDNKYPGFSLIYSNLGSTLSQQMRFEEAIVYIKEAIRIDPGYGQAHYNLGVVLAKQMKFEEAIVHYREAIRHMPSNTGAHNNIGFALSQQMNFAEAIVHYNEAIRLKPDYAGAQDNLGTALSNLKKFDEAIIHHREAIRLKPNQAESYYNLGISLSKLMKFEEAIVNYKEAIRLKPDYAEAHNNLGSSLGEQGNIEESIAHFEMAIKLAPGNAQAQNNLRAILSFKEKVKEAANHSKAANERTEKDKIQGKIQ